MRNEYIVRFQDLFDMNRIQKLQDSFATLTGTASIITDSYGRRVTRPSNFTRFCSDVVKKTPAGCANCRYSDNVTEAAISIPGASGPVITECLSAGLWDAGAGIYLGNRHIANWLIGQVRNSETDISGLLSYAREIGADEDEFMEALSEVPSMTRAEFENRCNTLFLMTKQLSELAYRNVALNREIEIRKHVEEELRLSRNLYRGLFENTGTATIIIEEDTTISLVNQKFAKLSGYTKGEIEGLKSWTEFVSEEDLDRMREYHVHLRSSTSSAPEEYEFGFLNSDGVRKYGLMTVGLIPGTKKSVASVLDITNMKLAEQDRRKIEAQMLNTQKLESLGVLAGGIAHDFNNMLMVVLGNADLAMAVLPEENPARIRLKEIEIVTRQAADLCNQMLAYSGRGQFVIEFIDMNDLIREMAHMLNMSVSKNTSIIYHFTDDLRFVQGDVSQLRQVIMNLIVNSSEAIGNSEGLISVTTCIMQRDQIEKPEILTGGNHLFDEYVLLEVADNGCGMDEATLNRIFDPFFTTKSTGRGLGMAAVLGIVRGQKGAISVESQPGSGSVFKFYLPVTEGEANGSHKTSSEPQSLSEQGAGTTVLLVDDEDAVRDVAKMMLEVMGFSVLTASNGHEAVVIFKNNIKNIACVILDLTMPGLTGEETYHEIKKISPNMRVILSSGYSEKDVSQLITSDGLAGFIQKPYSIERLSGKLHEILEGPNHSSGA